MNWLDFELKRLKVKVTNRPNGIKNPLLGPSITTEHLMAIVWIELDVMYVVPQFWTKWDDDEDDDETAYFTVRWKKN